MAPRTNGCKENFGQIVLETLRDHGPFWIGAPRKDWTKACRDRFGDFVTLDDVSDAEVRRMVEGHERFNVLIGPAV